MSVWFAIPSARPVGEAEACTSKWRAQGYRIALLRQGEPIAADLLIPTERYLGWAPSVNVLAKRILEVDPTAEWIVTGGDDYEPDIQHRADGIAAECTAHFCGTFGVMQPTGDRWGEDPTIANRALRGAYIDRICGSPWMGREWCERAYQGNGPMFGGYHHMFADEELQEVAVKLGVLWQRRDLTQMHMHWGRKKNASRADIPAFLLPVNSPQHWASSQRLFDSRKRQGFPGSEALLCV